MKHFIFEKPDRPVQKVFIHCTASDNPDHDNIATVREWHLANGWSGEGYHLFCRKSGHGEYGRSLEKTPAAQKGHNRGAIAICLHGLEEGKFTDAQKNWLIAVCIQIDRAYDGMVTFHGHCEVAAKACPVIDYRSILQLDEFGYLGDVPYPGYPLMVDLGAMGSFELAEAMPSRTVKMGGRGTGVRALQTGLKALGYHSGKVDGMFGKLTRAAVLAFQADNHLIEDGIAGRATFEALADAKSRELGEDRKKATLLGLASAGSRIARASLVQGATGAAMIAAGGAYPLLDQVINILQGVTDAPGLPIGPQVMMVLSGGLVILQAVRAGLARRDDHRKAKTL